VEALLSQSVQFAPFGAQQLVERMAQSRMAAVHRNPGVLQHALHLGSERLDVSLLGHRAGRALSAQGFFSLTGTLQAVTLHQQREQIVGVGAQGPPNRLEFAVRILQHAAHQGQLHPRADSPGALRQHLAKQGTGRLGLTLLKQLVHLAHLRRHGIKGVDHGSAR